jgi:hypothetical protein
MMSFACGIFGVVLFAMIAPASQRLAQIRASRISPVLILAIAAVVAHLISVLTGIVLTPAFHYWYAASIFAFGAMAYIFAFGSVYKSISLQILLGLTRHPGGVPLSAIVDGQIPEIFRERAGILVEGGLVVRDGASFAATEPGQKLAGRIAKVRRLFAIGETGLYDFN